jgi:carbonic anhydrase
MAENKLDNLQHLFENNRKWAAQVKEKTPDFFEKLSQLQTPKYLWIGCSDSRIPANLCVGLLPGEIFTHRNVANLVIHTDLNCLSVIQFAIEVLKIEHIIVVGHYGCGGVESAMKNNRLGLIDNWLRHIQDVMRKHESSLSVMESEKERFNRLCELNVVEQVTNVCETTIVQDAWQRGQSVNVHGWIYSLSDGLMQDLKIRVKDSDQMDALQHRI